MIDTANTRRQSEWLRITPFALLIFLVIFAYAIIRYNVLKGVDPEYIPLYILNKVLALSSVVYIGISYLLGPIGAKRELRRPFGLLGFACASVHSLISLILLTPYYYPSLYMGGKFTFYANLHLLFGVLATILFAAVAASSIPNIMQTTDSTRWRSIQRWGYIALIFVLLHVYTVGVNSWKDYTIWPGGLAPISLIAFTIIMFVLTMKIVSLILPRPAMAPIVIFVAVVVVSILKFGLIKFVRNENILPRWKNGIMGVDVSDPFADIPSYPQTELINSHITQLRFNYKFDNTWHSEDDSNQIARWYNDMLIKRGWKLAQPPSDWNATNLNLVFNKPWNNILAISITPAETREGNYIQIEISKVHQQEDVLY